MYLCISCSSWFDKPQDLNAHKIKKECAKIVIERAEAKKVVRKQQDAERKAKLEGNTTAVVTPSKEDVTVVSSVDVPTNNTESGAVPITTTAQDETGLPSVDATAFKQFLVANCDVKIQKISRLKEEKLFADYEEFLPAFNEATN